MKSNSSQKTFARLSLLTPILRKISENFHKEKKEKQFERNFVGKFIFIAFNIFQWNSHHFDDYYPRKSAMQTVENFNFCLQIS